MTPANTEREAVTDAVYQIVCGDGPIVDNEMAIYALVDVLAVIVASGVEGKPASNIDLVARTIGETIADKARRLLGPGHGVAQ